MRILIDAATNLFGIIIIEIYNLGQSCKKLICAETNFTCIKFCDPSFKIMKSAS